MDSFNEPSSAGQECTDVLEEIEVSHRLILLNDDFNTFEWVIETLMDVCKHDEVQAEQCAYIVHYKGKCAVSHGPFEKMKRMREQIVDRGIGAIVES